MKYCPTCETRYDEEILRFCMKDGTPLIEEGEPKFTAMPSESLEDDDLGEVTIIRKKGEVPIPPPVMDDAGELQPPAAEPLPQEPVFRPKEEAAPRIVVPMQPPMAQSRVVQPVYQQPPKSNTLKVAILTALGTVFLLGLGAMTVWFLMRDTSSNSNVNTNPQNANVNLNTNLGYDANFNFNATTSSNSNSNANSNANAKSPTPTPKPSPSTTPSPSPTPDDDDTTPSPRPSPTVPTMSSSPRPSPTVPRMMPSNRPANRPANN